MSMTKAVLDWKGLSCEEIAPLKRDRIGNWSSVPNARA